MDFVIFVIRVWYLNLVPQGWYYFPILMSQLSSSASDDDESGSSASDDDESGSSASDDDESGSSASDDDESGSSASDDDESGSSASDDLESGSSASDDDESENSYEGELLNQILEERVPLTDIIDGESKPLNSDTNSVQVYDESMLLTSNERPGASKEFSGVEYSVEDIKMESNTTLEAPNSDTNCDLKYDESKLLALEEKTRASEKFSRDLRREMRRDLESGSSASDDDGSENSFEEGSLSQNLGELNVQAALTKKISEEWKPQKTIEIIDFETNFNTASISCGEESKVFQEQTVHAKKNPEVGQKPKYFKNLKPRAHLHDLLIEKCLKEKSKKSALYIESEKELGKITENIDLNSNVSILSRNKSQIVSEKKLFKEFFNFVQNTPENIDFKPKVDDNQDTCSEILCHRILFDKNSRNVKKLGRESKLLKERKNTYQSVELTEELEMSKGNSDLCKLSIDNKSISKDRVTKAKEVNANKQAFLFDYKIRIEKAFQENLKLQKMIPEHEPTKKGRKWTNYTAAIFGMPYFKDKNKKFSCPPNADTILRIESGHPLNPARDDSGKWTKKEISKLKSSVEEILRDKLLSNLSAQVNEIKESNVLESTTSGSVNANMSSSSVAESSPPLVNKRKCRVKTSKTRATSKSTNRQPSTGRRVKNCNPKKNASQLRSLDILNQKISQGRAMSLIELMSEVNIDDEYDWQVISTNTFSLSRSASECQGYFKMIHDPSLNHEGWTKEENDMLVLLADKYSCQDWDAIATDLGTNRSAYQCCSHFEKNFDKNIRVTGKWSKDEDDKLIDAVKKFQVGNHIPWWKISYFMTTRSVNQIRSHWTNTLDPHLKKGRFTPKEDKLLLTAIDKRGLSFRSAATLFKNRTARQIKGRYIRKMENARTKGRWSLEEDKTLLKLVDEIGVGKWKKISEHFKTRTRTQVRQRYNHIKSLMDQYPGLEVEDLCRRAASKKSAKQTDEETPKNAAVACNTNSLVASSETDKNITCEAEVSKDASNTRKTRKKSKVLVDVSMPTESAAVASNTKSLVASSEADLEIDGSKDAPNTRKTRKKSKLLVDVSMPTESAAVASDTKSLVASSEADLEIDGSKDAPNTRKTRKKSKLLVDVSMPTESAAVASDTKSLVASSEADLEIDGSKDAPNTRKTGKRKSEVSVDAIMPPPKRTKTLGAINKDQRGNDFILKSRNKKTYKKKSPVREKLLRYFQEAYPMQEVVGKKTWNDTDISTQAKVMFDLSHILRVDYSYIDDPNRQRAVRPFMLKNIVNRMLENHGDKLLRLNPATSDHHSNEDQRPECDVAESDTSHIDYVPVPVDHGDELRLNPATSDHHSNEDRRPECDVAESDTSYIDYVPVPVNHGDELLRLNPATSDHHSNEDRRPECDVAESDTSHIDYVPVPVEETLCADPFPGDFDDDSDRILFSPRREDKDAEREKQRQLVQEKKKEFMEFTYLVPPNVSTAVGFRSLLLVEPKLREPKLRDPNANDDQGSDAPPPPPPDYTPSQFRMKNAAAVAASDAHLHNQCVRFTKEEAIHMFQERLKALFAGPIVMSECADRHFTVNNLPMYKSGPLSKNKRD
ncbi:hypothetical protein LSTR_LSTR007044 [Laodelphax striatellus]|uniref:Uncharacterized protein n=1 Tax=Laodelphax striatellus TaxID=195883 RepID=A0A482WK96_LAOST|nr:hypothetical protein LSTR_LSTR007044 [Laodelphax striatellus]